MSPAMKHYTIRIRVQCENDRTAFTLADAAKEYLSDAPAWLGDAVIIEDVETSED